MIGYLVFCLVVGLAPEQQQGVVRGIVLSEATGVPLVHARVEILLGTGVIRAVTDSAGAYQLGPVPAGRWRLRASHIDHAPHEVEVQVGGRQVVLHLSLELRPIVLPPVRATGAAGETTARGRAAAADSLQQPPPLGHAIVRALDGTPGIAELGLAAAARQGLPGQEPTDPSDVLFVRGSAADLKLVLLDGAPVYSPFHVGGLIPAFSEDVLSRADLFLGGAPARYDGGLSYILDLETRPARGDRFRAAGTLDMLGGRVGFESPFGSRAAILADARAVHGAAATRFVDGEFPYAYADGLVRMDVRLGDAAVLRATGFWNQEAVDLGAGEADIARPRWGNRALSFRFRSTSAGGPLEITAAYGRFESSLPVSGLRPYIVEGAMERSRLNLDRARRFGSLLVEYGAGFEQLQLGYRTISPPGDTEPLRAERWTPAQVLGAYLDTYVQPAERLSLRGGLRADLFRPQNSPRLAPRLAVTWLFNQKSAATLAAGRYHQYVRAPDRLALPALTNSEELAGGDLDVDALQVGHATHLTFALNQELEPEIWLGVEAFFKRFGGMPAEDRNGLYGEAPGLTSANASGVDFWLRRTGRTRGWLGYSLAWLWADERLNTDLARQPGSGRFAGRHLVSGGIEGHIGSLADYELRIAYGAGLPYTAIPSPRPRTTHYVLETESRGVPSRTSADSPPLSMEPDDPYLRLDASISRVWSADVRGRTYRFAPYFKILNALDRRDGLFYRAEPDDPERPRALAPLPVIPLLGFEWRF